MLINTFIFDYVLSSKKTRILVVTKYFDSETTDFYIKKLKKYDSIIFGYGENRIEQILEKNIPREQCHFIGNIQSRKIKNIILHCSCIHSIGSLEHLQQCQKICKELGIRVQIFLQLHLDPAKDYGFSFDELIEIFSQYKEDSLCEVIGISGMGKGICGIEEKKSEFNKLLTLRNIYFPPGLISAGTSRDYKVAIEKGIDIVRIGRGLFN